MIDTNLTRSNLPVEVEDIRKIKKLALIAMFSDDELMDMLVLKGGNAIEFAYGLEARYSADLDFSLPGDLQGLSIEEFREKAEKALREQFGEQGYVVFDVTIEEKPPLVSEDMKDFWGGYKVEFKLIEKSLYQQHNKDIEALRKRSATVNPAGSKSFQIDISKYEYCDGKGQFELDDYTIYVYTPAMIVAEKLRAICQQMEEYGKLVKSSSQSPRGRDFFDIHLLVTSLELDMTSADNLELIKRVFEAKRVPLHLFGRIPQYRDYHERGFPIVPMTLPPDMEASSEFDYYFDYVVELSESLKALWME